MHTFTVVGFYRFTEAAACEFVEAKNAGEAAYEVTRRREGTDYTFLGVVEGKHKLIGDYSSLNLEALSHLSTIGDLANQTESTIMTVIGFDRFNHKDVKALVSESLQWELAMTNIWAQRGSSWQPVCVLEDAVGFTITQDDLDELMEGAIEEYV